MTKAEIKKGSILRDTTMPNSIIYKATGRKHKGGFFQDYKVFYEFEEISQSFRGEHRIGFTNKSIDYITEYMK